jgi:protein-L-isoaspartate(D-aspartate) O-methyltransferase
VLSPLVKHVYTIEIVESLGRTAAERLEQMGYGNVSVRIGDGYQGWPEHAPFDKIIVTCAPTHPPQPLVEQLREGGIMVIPYGETWDQNLHILRKQGTKLHEESVLPVAFVPMTGEVQTRH